MAIHLHRSNRSEVLVEMLTEVLRENWPSDPFLEFPIVVGSRGMERWLRHEIATRIDIAAGLAFPFPRQALTGAARWLLGGAEDPRAPFWDANPATAQETQGWGREALTFELVALIRARLGEPAFASVARYLGEGTGPSPSAAEGPVTARELLFAGEVGDVLDRLMHDRPADAIRWAEGATIARGEAGRRVDGEDSTAIPEEHLWLAALLGDLGAASHPESPAVLHRELAALRKPPPGAAGRVMCIFGLSTMGPGDRARLAAIARSLEVHLFLLVPTDQWIQYQRTPGEANAARRAAHTEADRERVEAELASDNPILISLGAPSRDSQVWLEEVGYLGDHLESQDPLVDPGPATALDHLQSWILRASSVEGAAEPWAIDASISAHSTYGALRQCEVLRDELLAMFAADPSLEPRDVVVMTPDIETYAPLVAAVFSRRGLAQGPAGQGEQEGREDTSEDARLPRIPVAIADLGLRRTNPVAEVLLECLEAAGERLTASRVLEFLALEPVRRRWGLDDDDLADMRDLIRDSGLRWGMDAGDREAVGQPALDQNTVRFALERLALGVLMPDEAELGVVAGTSPSFAPAVPFDIESQHRAQRVGRLGVILGALGAVRAQLAEPATLGVWRDRLGDALDALAATSEKTSWLRFEVDAALQDLARDGARLGDLPVERSAVLRRLEGGFEMPSHGDRAITGAVQVCALEPMRSVPFRVVALLGMDDKAFPRGGRRRTWDPMEQRRAGERDRREVDRHLMLEAILSARDRLILLWSGHDVQEGKEQPAAVPVEELLETLGKLTGNSRRDLVHQHPLQPWSAGNFGSVPQSFDRGMAAAAMTLREIEHGARPARPLGLAASGTAVLPPDAALPEVLELDDLARALLRPHEVLLRDRLGLSVNEEEAVVTDREPLELDSLEAWSLRSRVAKHLLAGAAPSPEVMVEALRARLAGEGTLPLRAGGMAVLRGEVGHAEALVDNLSDVAGERAPALELALKLPEGMVLVGRVDQVVERDGELLLHWWTPSKEANERTHLVAWLHLLAAVATGQAVAGARLVGYASEAKAGRAGGAFLAFDGGPEDARAALAALVGLYRLARERPIPLFRRTSFAAAEVLATAPAGPVDRALRMKLVAAVAGGWHGGMRTRGDVDDPWISTFFVDYDPLDHLDGGAEGVTGDGAGPGMDRGLLALARQVWVPVHRARVAGAALAGAWANEAGS